MFIDLHKAYDTVPVNRVFKVLQDTNINYTLIRALKNLYEESTSQIKIGNTLSGRFFVNKIYDKDAVFLPHYLKYM